MYLLTLKNRKTEGAYAVQDAKGDKVLFCLKKKMMLKDTQCS